MTHLEALTALYFMVSVVAFILISIVTFDIGGTKYKLDYTLQQKIFVALGWLPVTIIYLYDKIKSRR